MKIIQKNQPLTCEKIVPADCINEIFLNLTLFNFFYKNKQIVLINLSWISHFSIFFQKICKQFKINFQNFKPLFPVILRIFDLECHGQTSLKIPFLMFGYIFMKFRKLRCFRLENKKLDCHKTQYFHYISHSLFYGAKCYLNFSKCCSEFSIDMIRLAFGKLFN